MVSKGYLLEQIRDLQRQTDHLSTRIYDERSDRRQQCGTLDNNCLSAFKTVADRFTEVVNMVNDRFEENDQEHAGCEVAFDNLEASFKKLEQAFADRVKGGDQTLKQIYDKMEKMAFQITCGAKGHQITYAGQGPWHESYQFKCTVCETEFFIRKEELTPKLKKILDAVGVEVND